MDTEFKERFMKNGISIFPGLICPSAFITPTLEDRKVNAETSERASLHDL